MMRRTGSIIGCRRHLRDITERKKAEEKLRLYERFAERVEGIIVTDS